MDKFKDQKVISIKEKIKKFFKKISNEKDQVNLNVNPDANQDKRLYRDDLKMY
jgi:hypothetical protein